MYRCTDPCTSIEAAVSLNVPHLEAVIFSWLSKRAGSGGTSEEIAEALQLPRVTVSPRMKPLERKGLVQASEQRRYGQSGRAQIVWLAVCPAFLV
jgi:predicted ArsR family transcriptional regulator